MTKTKKSNEQKILEVGRNLLWLRFWSGKILSWFLCYCEEQSKSKIDE